MWADRVQHLSDNFSRISRRDRVFLNNPVVMSGMGLAPLVVAATTGYKAWMLSVAVLLLLTSTRVLAAWVSRWLKFRALAYCLCSSALYIAVYYAMNALFPRQFNTLGMYLPLLVVEPLIIKRYERPTPEKLTTALRKGLITTAGYALVLMLVGILREFLASGAFFGSQVASVALLPMAGLASGGFVVVAVVCAVWRAGANIFKKRINMEAKKYQ